MKRFKGLLLVVSAGLVSVGLLLTGVAGAEVCTTQSQMKAADREGLAGAALGLAAKMQAGDAAGLRSATVAELQKDFSGVERVVGETAPKLKGGVLTVQQVYALDGADLKRGADGNAPDAQFYCALNRTTAEVDFLIPALPPGKYGFAMVESQGGTAAWRLSFLLREEQGRWLMAGLYPKAVLAAGHDGLWYWTQARQMLAKKEEWNAWLYFQEAETLLRPADFVQSTHLEKLRAEETAAAPPALSDGVSAEAPLVVKAADGKEYHFTGLGVDDSLAKEKVDVVAHLKAEPAAEAEATAHKGKDGGAANPAELERRRTLDAMKALLTAYPEMRLGFHGVWIFAEVPGQNPFAMEQPMSEIH